MDIGRIADALPSHAAVAGLGYDVVDVDTFAAQLAEPDSRMRLLFSARERQFSACKRESEERLRLSDFSMILFQVSALEM